MKITHQQRQFGMSSALLLLFGAILCMASFLPGPLYPSNFSSKKGAEKIVVDARGARLHKNKSIGTKDDPNARDNYEFERLKDPNTGKIPENIRERELAFSSRIPTAEQILRQKSPFTKMASANWSHRGPYNVGGRTRAFAFDVSNENVLLAGGVSGGMWRSTNGGTTWSKTTDPNQLHSVTTVAQDKRPGKTNVWYYGSGEILGNSASKSGASYYGNGIFKSVDNGATWNPLSSTQTTVTTTFNNAFEYTYRVATNPANSTQDEVLAAIYGGIRRSVNGGVNWTPVLGFGANIPSSGNAPYFADLDISSTGVMYAGLSQLSGSLGTATEKGAFRSTNGTTWTNITPASWPAIYERIVMDISPSNENIVYYFVYSENSSGAETPNLWKYEYLSGDGSGAGGTWTNLSANIPMLGGKSGNLDLQGGYNMVVKVKPDNSNVVILGGTNLYISTNGFTSTSTTKKIGGYVADNLSYNLYPAHHPDQHEVSFSLTNPRVVYSAHDGGISKTTNVLASQVEWTSLNRGYLTTQFYTVAMDLNSIDNFIVGGMQDNGSWYVEERSETQPWQEAFGGDGAFAAVTEHSLLVSAQNAIIYRFIFNQDGYTGEYSRINPPKAKGYLFINPYNVDPNNEHTLYLPAGDTLWRHKNIDALPRGEVQTTVGWDVIAALNTNEVISAVGVSKVPANVVYFGTRAGKLYKIQYGLGVAPTKIEITGSNFPAGNIGCIAVDPRDANKVVATFTNYGIVSLFYTTDGGNSWTAVAGNLEENPNGSGSGPSTRWVSILPSTNGNIKYFVGTSTGLYATSSLDGTATNWVREGNTSIGQVPVDMVISRTTDDLVVVGTHGNGVYSARYDGPLAAAEEVDLAIAPGLGQSYPNPFRKGMTTTIPFTLTKASQVNLTLFDLTGKAVTTLVNGKLTAGRHTATWNGKGKAGQELASGTYLYQLTVDGKRETKRVAYIK
ncbi:FlgD immunoglobulin-like domain containing protein [Rufibacter sp. DG15C]|uniref:FlgD immunoglobulin-like domain containing protein n=1 Tax=Rufibacter sp. DG15C TaxID=1379909 RepID=UPI000833B7BF|nr:FlgD immunoglobulin-like domain containing protein [Rufibacter sp. DG15C]